MTTTQSTLDILKQLGWSDELLNAVTPVLSAHEVCRSDSVYYPTINDACACDDVQLDISEPVLVGNISFAS